MKLCLFLPILFLMPIACVAQECGYRTDGPTDVYSGNTLINVKSTVGSLVRGSVSDQNGEPIPRATVVLSKIEKGKTEYKYVGTTLTDEKGKFCFGMMQDGKYLIVFAHSGLNSVKVELKVRSQFGARSLSIDLPVPI